MYRWTTLVALLLSMACICAAGAFNSVVFQSPLPGAQLVTPESRIILRISGQVDPVSLTPAGAIDARGSASGSHPGRIVPSRDLRTLQFVPDESFTLGETVSVSFARSFKLLRGESVLPEPFSFVISHTRLTMAPEQYLNEEMQESRDERERVTTDGPKGPPDRTTAGAVAPLPLNFPFVQTTTFGTPSPGRIFLSNFSANASNVPHLLILDDDGQPVFFKPMHGSCLDFKMQPNGLLTYYDTFLGYFIAMDSTYQVVDSFRCGNGYSTDLHELRLLDNGHALLMSYDPQVVDMSAVVPGGKPTAVVTGLVIQELDEEKNVVFQWRSWDHFQITDATHENLTAAAIDYVHGNAIDLDQDGNLLISSRHLDEITKINRETGDIMWRMGGKNNQFTFLNDSIGYSHQHAIRRLPNGNVTLFDNGNFHATHYSRALEYQLDEVARTATLVWQFRRQPDDYGAFMGYVQRLDNGNTLIGWGAGNPAVTEVNPSGDIVFELRFDNAVYSYRAFRYLWHSADPRPPFERRFVADPPAKLPQSGERPDDDPIRSAAGRDDRRACLRPPGAQGPDARRGIAPCGRTLRNAGRRDVARDRGLLLPADGRLVLADA